MKAVIKLKAVELANTVFTMKSITQFRKVVLGILSIS